MVLGKAWLLIEESFHNDECRLLSVPSPRKSNKDIAEYIEQSYVDRFASFEEAVSYKNNPKKSPFRIEPYEISSTTIVCGHEPIYRAYRCHQLDVLETKLAFRYYVFKGEFENKIKEEHSGIVNL